MEDTFCQTLQWNKNNHERLTLRFVQTFEMCLSLIKNWRYYQYQFYYVYFEIQIVISWSLH